MATIDEIKREILSKLNLESEFQSFGINLIGKPSPKGWIRCPSPFNPDKFPSCGVNVDGHSSFGGYLRIFNNSGPRHAIGFFDLARELGPCSGKEFIEVLKYYADKAGVEFDYEPAQKKVPKAPKGEIIATYDYIDTSGKLIYQVCRLKPKSFRQRRPDPNKKDAWVWNMDGVTPLPYLINNVIDNKTIYITEGEGKCDDLINNFNLPATTFVGGAGKFWPDVLPYFKDKHIIILPDNDTPGKEHATRLAREFQNTAASIKIVELPGLEPKGDISDWIAAGGTKEAFLDLCKKTLNFEASEDPIDELNKTHAIVGIGDKVCILHELINEKNKLELKFMTEYSFNLKYRNREIPNPLAGGKGQSKTMPLATAWLKSYSRRCYDKVVFAPNGVDERFYNLYQGLAYEPIQGDWSLFRSHIFKNICKGNIFYFDWLMAWMARIVQNPGGERPGTVVVLKGLKGTGKDVFVQAFGKIFGDHFLEVSSQDHIVGKFNNHLRSVILLFANEAWFAGDKAVEGAFKRLITSPSMVIEPKGIDAFSVDNHLNCIVASDGDWVVPVGDNERRFFILDVSEEHLQDLEYFGAIDDQMYHMGGISAFLYDLMQIDYKKHVLRQAPKTEALVYQASLNFNSFQKFWYNILQDGPDWPWHSEGRIEIKKLHSQYIDFCKDLNLRYPIDAVIFGKNISKYNKISDDMTIKEQQMVNGERIFFYKFPDKDVCRKLFCRVINNEIDFEDGVVFGIDSI